MSTPETGSVIETGSVMLLAASDDWFVGSPAELWQAPIAAVCMLGVVIALVRLVGLRSFSKMSSFDFAVTVSIGSILAAVATRSVVLANGVVATASLLGVQAVISWFRSRSDSAEAALDNSPLLLMDGPTLLVDNLRTARVSRSDVIAKLREANVLRLDEVRAVVLEATGDISVLHGDRPVEPILLEGVRGWDDGADRGPDRPAAGLE